MDIEPYVLLLLGVCLIFGGFFVDSIADKAMPAQQTWSKPTPLQRATFLVVGAIALILGISRLWRL